MGFAEVVAEILAGSDGCFTKIQTLNGTDAFLIFRVGSEGKILSDELLNALQLIASAVEDAGVNIVVDLDGRILFPRDEEMSTYLKSRKVQLMSDQFMLSAKAAKEVYLLFLVPLQHLKIRKDEILKVKKLLGVCNE